MPLYDEDGNELASPSTPVGELFSLGEVGGDFDESMVVLTFSGEHLDRFEISSRLGVKPSKAWNPGELFPVGNGTSGLHRKTEWGKWILSSPRDSRPVDEKLRELLAICTQDIEVWVDLAQRHEAWIAVVGFLENWNRELLLDPRLLGELARRSLTLKVDVYFDACAGESGRGSAPVDAG